MSDPTTRALVLYGAVIAMLFVAVGTLDYQDQVAEEQSRSSFRITPRCPEVYRGRYLSGWIITQADRGPAVARCVYKTRT